MKKIIIILLVIIICKLSYDIFYVSEKFSNDNGNVKISGYINNSNNSNSIKLSQVCSTLDNKKTCIDSAVIQIMNDLPALRKNSICIGNTNCFNPYNLKVLKGETPFIFNLQDGEALTKGKLYHIFAQNEGFYKFGSNGKYLTVETGKTDGKYLFNFNSPNAKSIQQSFQAIYLGQDGAFLESDSEDIGCYGDFGDKLGDAKCCNAPGPPPSRNSILDVARICPPWKPMCKGYIQNERYGTCVDTVLAGKSTKDGISSMRIALKVNNGNQEGFISIDSDYRLYLNTNIKNNMVTLNEQFYVLNTTQVSNPDPSGKFIWVGDKRVYGDGGEINAHNESIIALQNLKTGNLVTNKNGKAYCDGTASDNPKALTIPGGSSTFYAYSVNQESFLTMESASGKQLVGDIFTKLDADINNSDQKFLFKNSKPIPNLKTIFKQPKPAKLSYNGTFESTKTIPIKIKQNPIKFHKNSDGNIKKIN